MTLLDPRTTYTPGQISMPPRPRPGKPGVWDLRLEELKVTRAGTWLRWQASSRNAAHVSASKQRRRHHRLYEFKAHDADGVWWVYARRRTTPLQEITG